MFTTILNVTTSNGTKEVEIDGRSIDEARQKLNRTITEIFGKNGGNNRELKAVSTLVNLSGSDNSDWVTSMQLSWNKLWRMWEIWYDNYDDLAERFVSFSGAISVFCERLFPTE